MTSWQLCEDALNRFLADENPGILAIKGRWGVGKTYCWSQYIEANKESMDKKAYSYVSLFGTRSVSEVKHQIFAKQQSLKVGTDDWLNQGGKLLQKALKHVDAGALTSYLSPIKNTDLFADWLQEKLLNDYIICIDDLERMEESITASSLLGFLTSLRDERNCKVVLLYNDSEIERGSELEKTLSEYREKVFDREILYDPSVKECVEIIFRESADEYLADGQINASRDMFLSSDDRGLVRLLEDGKINNVRIVRKIKDALDYFAPEIKEKYSIFWPYFANQAIKLLCLYYSHGDEFTLAELIDSSSLDDFFDENRDDPEKKARYERRSPIREIGYSPIDGDRIVVEYLTNGYVNWPNHERLLLDSEEAHRNSESRSESQQIYSKLWDNFQCPQEDFVSELRSFLLSDRAFYSLPDLDYAIRLIEELNDGAKEDELRTLLEKEIEEIAKENAGADFWGMHWPGYSKELLERVSEVASKHLPEVPVGKAIRMLSKSGGWNPSDLVFLKERTMEELYEWLRTEAGSDVLAQIKEFLSRFRGDSDGKETCERLVAALHKIAERSKIDEIRVYKRIGITRPEVGSTIEEDA